jgi:hypothetical protein
MLSSSAIAFGYDLNIAAIRDPSIPSGVPGGHELLSFVDAIVEGELHDLSKTQSAIIDVLGAESLVDASGAFGNFEMMNRVAEGTGIPVSAQANERTTDTIEKLGLNSFLKS